VGFAVDLIQDIVEKLMRIMMPSLYYFSLLIHTRTKGDPGENLGGLQSSRGKGEGRGNPSGIFLNPAGEQVVGLNIL